MVPEDYLPDYCRKRVLVLGCGNVLLGDDGFGPAVIDVILESDKVPDDVCFLKVGTSSREILFNIVLSEKRPQKIIVVDAMECGQPPGSVIELSLDSIPVNKIADFSTHQVPTSNLLRELRDLCGVDVRLVVMQPQDIPEEVRPGLSETANKAVPEAIENIYYIIENE